MKDLLIFGKIFIMATIITFCILFVAISGISYLVHSNDSVKTQLSPNYQEAYSSIQGTVDIPIIEQILIAIFCGFAACYMYTTMPRTKPEVPPT